jgi:hypothetical protein
VQLTSPTEGVYAVYVGRLDPSKPIKGTLTVSAAIDAAPAQK